jgi:hypothetical protein
MSSPPPDDNLPELTEEEFNKALEDPAFVASLQAHYRKILNGDFGNVSPEERESIQKALNAHSIQEKFLAIRERLEALNALAQRPAGSMRAEDRLAEAQRLFDEITDAGLELSEPYRTELLKDVVKLREQVKALRVE